MGSCESEIFVHPMINGVSHGKTEKKIFLSLFFSQLVLQIHLYTYVLCVCTVWYDEGRDILTSSSRMWFSTEKTSFIIERYFFTNKKSFWFTTSSTRIISFLYLIPETSTFLNKIKFFPLVRVVLSRNLFHAPPVPQRHPCVLLLCTVDFE
jgi:hypothetical protein